MRTLVLMTMKTDEDGDAADDFIICDAPPKEEEEDEEEDKDKEEDGPAVSVEACGHALRARSAASSAPLSRAARKWRRPQPSAASRASRRG